MSAGRRHTGSPLPSQMIGDPMHAAPSFPPPLLEALARIRAALREAKPGQAALLYQMLLGLSLQALTEALPVLKESVPLGQRKEASQGSADRGSPEGRVTDLWISPKDAAHRLGHSERWLRRRRARAPYCAFCIAGDSGRGYRVSLCGLEAYMERERKRAAG